MKTTLFIRHAALVTGVRCAALDHLCDFRLSLLLSSELAFAAWILGNTLHVGTVHGRNVIDFDFITLHAQRVAELHFIARDAARDRVFTARAFDSTRER